MRKTRCRLTARGPGSRVARPGRRLFLFRLVFVSFVPFVAETSYSGRSTRPTPIRFTDEVPPQAPPLTDSVRSFMRQKERKKGEAQQTGQLTKAPSHCRDSTDAFEQRALMASAPALNLTHPSKTRLERARQRQLADSASFTPISPFTALTDRIRSTVAQQRQNAIRRDAKSTAKPHTGPKAFAQVISELQ